MNRKQWMRGGIILVGLAMLVVGCAKPEDRGGAAQGKGATKENKHDDWWCVEHGIPEDECSMCSPKVAAACKKKGDWCQEHDRAKSQCFICDPALKEVFAAKYRAKYGKEPPPITEELPAKKDGK